MHVCVCVESKIIWLNYRGIPLGQNVRNNIYFLLRLATYFLRSLSPRSHQRGEDDGVWGRKTTYLCTPLQNGIPDKLALVWMSEVAT